MQCFYKLTIKYLFTKSSSEGSSVQKQEKTKKQKTKDKNLTDKQTLTLFW